MPRLPKKIKRKRGNQGIQIDWKMVENSIIKGSNGVQISAKLNINPNTLYEHCLKDHGIIWREYFRSKRAIGDSMLHEAQFDSAIEKMNVQMLVHLGEYRLGQTKAASANDGDESKTADKVDIENKLMEVEALLNKYREKHGPLDVCDQPKAE